MASATLTEESLLLPLKLDFQRDLLLLFRAWPWFIMCRGIVAEPAIRSAQVNVGFCSKFAKSLNYR